jgi:uncharacterized membrane protein YfcA
LDLSLGHLLLLLGSAFVAGSFNAVAGGGTIFTFPSLLAIGVLPLTANGTSTTALVPGSMAAFWVYRKETARTRLALLFCVPSLAGGALGAMLSLRVGDHAFRVVVPWLILTATLLFLVQERVRRKLPIGAPRASGVRLAALLLGQLCIAVYGGFFGAGMGILILATLAAAGFSDVHEMNGLKNMTAACINGMAMIAFIGFGRVNWPLAGIMTTGAIAGGYGGARLARRLGQQRVRQIIVGCGLVLTVVMFARM